MHNKIMKKHREQLYNVLALLKSNRSLSLKKAYSLVFFNTLEFNGEDIWNLDEYGNLKRQQWVINEILKTFE